MTDLSIHLNSNIVQKVEAELENLYAVIDAYQALQAIELKVGATNRNLAFWRELTIALTNLFVINWCKLFGVDSEDRFWKQATLEQKDFRDKLYTHTRMDYNQWNQYRHQMHDLKNELILHFTPYHKITHAVELKPAFLVAECCHDWLYEVMQVSEMGEGHVKEKDYVQTSLTQACSALESLN